MHKKQFRTSFEADSPKKGQNKASGAKRIEEEYTMYDNHEDDEDDELKGIIEEVIEEESDDSASQGDDIGQS